MNLDYRGCRPPFSFFKEELSFCDGAWDKYCDLRSKQKKTVVKSVDRRTGSGLFAAEFINRSSLIVEYTGEKIHMDVLQLGEDKFNFDVGTDEYLVKTANGKIAIDAGLVNAEHIGKFINHSCAPNCGYFTVDVAEHNAELKEEIEVVFIYAIRDIKKGEELRCCYGWSSTNSLPREICLCGSMNCSDMVGVKGYPLVVEEVVDGEGPSGDHVGTRVKFTFDVQT